MQFDQLKRREFITLLGGAAATWPFAARPAIAAKAATSTIPIVFTSNDDPRKYGLVASPDRPGGNVTGASWFSAELGPKRLALLHDLVPNVTTVALLLNPNNAETARQPAELQDAARDLGLQLVILNASIITDIDSAFATIIQNRIGALVVAADSFLASRREQITTLAARPVASPRFVRGEPCIAGRLRQSRDGRDIG